jgi:ATP-dependent DNA helicase DinG
MATSSPTPLGEAHGALEIAMETSKKCSTHLPRKCRRPDSLLRRTRQARFDLEFIVSQAERNYVYWIERRGKGIFLRASPVDVSELLREKLFDNVETCVLTSATLSSSGSFNFVRERLGLDAKKTSGFTAADVVRFRTSGDSVSAQGDARPAHE